MKKTNITCLLKYVSIAASVLLALNAGAQPLDELKAALTNYHQHYIAEKLFIHVNKDFFATGEIAWFKLYCIEGATNKPMDMSKVAYVELLDSKNTPVLQTKVALKKATGNGSLYLPLTLAGGNYTLRAYTNWMKNAGSTSFYEQKITIANLLQATVTTSKTMDDYDIQFMPEGGNLVQGISGKVAVKITGSDGYGATYNGAVVNEVNDTVARFAQFKFGIGSFNFTPVGGHTYSAVIKVNGKTIKKSMPGTAQSGYALHAEDRGNTWAISATAIGAAETNLYMLVHNSAGVISAVVLKSSSTYTLDKTQLKEGINVITLFNSQRQPVCERLIFKRPANELRVVAKTDAAVYEQRKKVTIGINTGTLNAANLSLSVFKTDSLQKATQVGISTYLWLSSALKGAIESPEYYLTASADADKALDNLLLAQGWRGFNRADAKHQANYKFDFLPEYAGNVVYAGIKYKSTGLPAKGVVTYLTIPDTTERLYTALSDSTGLLKFDVGQAYGNHEIVLQTNHFTDTTRYNFELVNQFSNQYGQPALQLPLNATPDQLDEYDINMQVQNAYHAADTRKFYPSVTDTLPFYGTPNGNYILDNFTRFTTTEEVLQEYITYIENVRRGGKLYIRMYNQNGVLDDNPLITVDGVPIFDNNRIYSIDPLKIKRINIINKRFLQGPVKYQGLLTLASKKGDMGGFEIDPRAVILDYKGLQEQRQFYSPRYDTDVERASRIPDYRNALYWNPDITTDGNGTITVSFYTSDLAGKYTGVIQGITAGGVAGSSVFTFEVK